MAKNLKPQQHLFNNPDNPLKTKGNLKRKEMLNDLKNRDDFERDIKKYQKKQKYHLLTSGQVPNEKLFRLCYNCDNDRELFRLCYKYSVEPCIIKFFALQGTAPLYFQHWADRVEVLDMCKVERGLVSLIESRLQGVKISKQLRSLLNLLQLQATLFPLAIAIHKNASQRDVIDFIKKNWHEEIEYNDMETENTRDRIRSKEKREIYDRVYKLHAKGNSLAQIESKLEEFYPEHAYTPFNISKIIGIEKKRRKKFTEPH